MEKCYLIALCCFGNESSYTNYQMQVGKTKEIALKKALQNVKGSKCVLIRIQRVKKSLINIILEHNKQGAKNE